MNDPRPETRRRLGLFGGSFDPIHRGHLHAARVAQRAFDLHRVVFVPAARPPHKPGRRLVPGAHRLAMVRLALAGEPTWCASDLELRRAGPSFTIDTVAALPEEVGEPADALVHLILGTDNLAGLPGWRAAEELLRRTRPIVVLRDDDPAELPREVVARLSPEAAARLQAGFVRAPACPGRATDLREALRTGVGDLSDLPDEVGQYILDHGLYGVCRWR